MGSESCLKTTRQALCIDRLPKITHHPIIQRARAVKVIGIASHQDCRNPLTCLDEVAVKFDAGHRRHVDISDQAGGFAKAMGREEISCR